MGKIARRAHSVAGVAFSTVMIVGTAATFVVKGFVEDSAHEYKHQREHGFLNASFWQR